MIREVISTPDAPAAIGPYSQGIRAQGDFYFFSGQIPLTPAGEMVEGGIEAQITQVLANMDALLKAVGLTPKNIVKSSIFLSSMKHFAVVNAAYGSFVGEDPPARSTFAVAELPRGAEVEIEIIAVG